jgi:acyl-CoA synthetase (AMP-forming)/AMP-acid ligase II
MWKQLRSWGEFHKVRLMGLSSNLLVSVDSSSGGACNGWRTLVDLARHRGAADSDRPAFLFLKDGDVEAGGLTFGELDRRARTAGAAMRARGAAGGRVLLLYPQGLDFIVAFFAALYAGAAAVPAPAVTVARVRRLRIQGIAADCGPVLALTPPDQQAAAQQILMPEAGMEGITAPVPVATLDELEREGAGAPPPPGIDPAAVALIQYTSGSTGMPKGVVVSHASILHNETLIQQRFGHHADTVFVGWLPMFHDMGLIGNMLQPVHVGCYCVLMPPVAFLEEPVRWLRAITRYRGTTAGAPNFAYDLCVDRIRPDQREGLDLSSWDVAYNGSEPVRASTLERFSRSFASSGFRPEAFYPCYGMAEATLLVAGPDKAARPRLRAETAEPGAAPLLRVGCGRTGLGQKLRIVDPETRCEVAPGAAGEIWLSGGSVAQGYWRRPEQTEAHFGATLAEAGDGRRYLRTGDLGLIADGELFVTGRIKDVMIVRGKNHYPQDVEATAQASHPALRADCAAAFLVEQGERERLVLLHEILHWALRAPPLKEIAGAVRAAVSRGHGLHVAAVVLLRPGSVLKTSSGKIRRHACRDSYLHGKLDVIGEDRHGQSLRPEPAAVAQVL